MRWLIGLCFAGRYPKFEMAMCVTSQTLFNVFKNSPKTDDSFIIFHDGLKVSRLNYEELTRNLEIISGALTNVSSQEVIGCLCRPHSVLPALMLGILKISSAFTFLDTKCPLSFLKNLEKHVLIRTILAEEKTLENLKSSLCSCWKTIKTLTVGDTIVKILHFSPNCLSSTCTVKFDKTSKAFHCHNDLAYVIQTSGTTGDPKIVQVPHQCIVPNILQLRSIYSVSSKDVILLCAPLTFDPSIVEIFLALSCSASLVIVSDSVKAIPRNLTRVIKECGVTIMQATPSLLQSCDTNLIQNEILSKNTSLRILSCGGERCPSLNKLRSWKSDGNATQFFNIYGITEVSCWGTIEKINIKHEDNNAEIALGKSLLDTDIEVRNENDEVIDEGLGQLFIGGSKRWCVLNDEPWPTQPCRLMRPTGDWVHKTKSGNMYFEGRQDSVIKYHGRKFSPCPLNKIIENELEIRSHSLYFNKEMEKLYVFIVMNENHYKSEDLVCHSVLRALQSAQPNIPPSVVVIVPFIPITDHGKADNKRLLKYVESARGNINVLERKLSSESVEEYLKALWQNYTGNNVIQDSSNFILDGGDSISSVQFMLEVEWKLLVSLPGLVEHLLNSTFKDVCKYSQECLTNVHGHMNKKFKRDEETSSSTITKKNDCTVLLTDRPGSSVHCNTSTSFESQSRLCYKVSSRQDKKLMCFCGKCFSSEPMTAHIPFESELFLQEEFKHCFEKCIDASPCCCDFIGSHMYTFIGSHSGYFASLDIKKGIVVWKLKLPDRVESSACISSCGNFVLVGCYDYNIYCFIAQSGEIKWKYRTNAEVKCSPVVSHLNIAYVGSHDHHLHAICVKSGRLIWKTKISNGSISASPALGVDNSFVCAATLDGVIASLNPDTGNIFWKYFYNTPLFSSPLIVKSNIFIGSVDGSMLHFNTSGELVEKYLAAGPIFSSASYIELPEKSENKDLIVFGSHSCTVYCFSTKGVLQWEYLCSSAVYATPFPFSINEQFFIAAACTKGTVYILSAHNGSLLHSFNCPGEIFSSPVVIHDYLIIGCRDNNLYCFKIMYKVSK